MGASGREFIKMRMEKEYFETLPPQIRYNCEIISVDVDGFDYSFDELHRELKNKSTKAYKKLKNREYELRHNKQ